MTESLSRKSCKSLAGMALQVASDSDAHWDAIEALRRKPEPQTLVWLKNCYGSRNWRKRVLAVNVICQLGQGSFHDVPYAVETARDLLGHALRDKDWRVREAALFGLGHREAPEHLDDMLIFTVSPREALRYALAFALGKYQDERATQALLTLMRDESGLVRDWATFGLGSLCELDSEEIRAGLLGAAEDVDPETRGEALLGLAQRKDLRATPLILKELVGPFNGSWAIDAAGMLGDPVFRDALVKLRTEPEIRNTPYFLRALEDAIAQCSKDSSPDAAQRNPGGCIT